jgi:hypothetical protein
MRIPGLRLFIAIPLLLSPLACVEQELTIESDPPGALVFLNDQELGRTPLKRDFHWYGDYDVRLQLDGYQTLKTHHRITPPWWGWVPFDLLANLMPFTVRDQQKMAFALKPADASMNQPENLLSRAEELRGKLEGGEFTRPPTPRNIPTTKEVKGATTKPTTLPAK